VISQAGAASLPDSHKEALAALRAGDAAAVGLAMQRDIAQGVDHVRAGLQHGKI
jgi:DNA-binding GntR family transcriptional regulator